MHFKTEKAAIYFMFMKNIFGSKTLPFWLFTISAILILTISQLIQDGVFMDGMLYISVAKNLADGLGTFWEPHFSKTIMTVFREQPPLYFGLLASFYKIFGTSMYVERLFCFVCFAFTLFYIHKIWRSLFFDDKQSMKNSWLPILFFATIPICFWSYAHHVEETVMALFATMSVYYLSEALFLKEKVIINILIAGICIFLSSLTKGVQGLFPITGVFFFWALSKQISFKKNIIYSILLVGTPFLIYALLILFNNHIYDVYKLYFENRLGKAFNSTVHNTTDNRFEIVIRLFTELIPMFILMLIIYLFQRKNISEENEQKNNRIKIYWLLLIGFSGSLPLISTLEQRGFYLLTSLPLFALAGAIAVSGRMKQLIEKINSSGNFLKYSRWITISIFLFSVLFTISKVGETKRDKELLSDIYSFGKFIPRGEIVSIPLEMWNDWNLQTYSVRYNYISLDGISGSKHKYLLIRKNLPKSLVPDSYEPYPIKTEYLDLYILKNKNQ